MPASGGPEQSWAGGWGWGGGTKISSPKENCTPFSLILNLGEQRPADSGWPYFHHREAINLQETEERVKRRSPSPKINLHPLNEPVSYSQPLTAAVSATSSIKNPARETQTRDGCVAMRKRTNSLAPESQVFRHAAVHGRPHTTRRGTRTASFTPQRRGCAPTGEHGRPGWDSPAGMCWRAESHCILPRCCPVPTGNQHRTADPALCFYRTASRERAVRPRAGRGAGGKEAGPTGPSGLSLLLQACVPQSSTP